MFREDEVANARKDDVRDKFRSDVRDDLDEVLDVVAFRMDPENGMGDLEVLDEEIRSLDELVDEVFVFVVVLVLVLVFVLDELDEELVVLDELVDDDPLPDPPPNPPTVTITVVVTVVVALELHALLVTVVVAPKLHELVVLIHVAVTFPNGAASDAVVFLWAEPNPVESGALDDLVEDLLLLELLLLPSPFSLLNLLPSPLLNSISSLFSWLCDTAPASATKV